MKKTSGRSVASRLVSALFGAVLVCSQTTASLPVSAVSLDPEAVSAAEAVPQQAVSDNVSTDIGLVANLFTVAGSDSAGHLLLPIIHIP